MAASSMPTRSGWTTTCSRRRSRGPRYAGTVKHHVPVLLTHGLFSNRQVCAPLAQYLAREGFDCWVRELRGHGASEKPATRPDPEDWGAYDVPTALDTVRALTGQGAVQLVAHSVGGLAFLGPASSGARTWSESSRAIPARARARGAGGTPPQGALARPGTRARRSSVIGVLHLQAILEGHALHD